VGQQLGNYRLLRVLGEGGFAQVYLGEHVYLKTPAAIKVLQTKLGQEELEQFQGEAQIIARLIHPQIVRVLEFGVEQGTPYLVMDYAPNGSMRSRLRRGVAQPPAALVPAVRQVAEALQYAHDQRLIHRDVKPENILLGRAGEFLLSDFGIATTAQTTSQQRTQGFAGTAAYSAPEQLQGKPVPASDQYALAVVVYECLTGDTLFHGSALEMATQHVLSPPPPLREKVPTIAPAVEQVVLTSLAKNAKERFGSVRAFATAFEQAAQGAPGVFPAAAPTGPAAAPISQPPAPAPAQPAPASGEHIYFAPTQLTPPGASPGWVSSPETPTFVTPPPAATPSPTQQTPTPTPPWRISASEPALPATFQTRPTPPSAEGGPPYRSGPPQPVPFLQEHSEPPPRRRKQLVAAIVGSALVVALIGGYVFSKGVLGGNTQTGSNTTTGTGGGTSTPGGSGQTTGGSSKLCNGQISIASDLPTTGTDGTEGLPAQNGVQLAVNQANLGGGYTLSLIPYNDVSAALGKHDPDQGAKNVTDMVSNKCILGMIGPFNSNVAKAEIPISEAAGMVMISPSNTNPGLTIQATAKDNGIAWEALHPKGANPETYFRLPGNDVAQGKLDADLVFDTLGARRVYVIDDQETYGVGLANYFMAEFQARGGFIVSHDGIPANDIAIIPALAAKIISFKPDAVFYGGVTSTGGGTLKAQLVANGYTGPMVGGDGIALDPAFLQQAGSAADGTYASNAAPDLSTLTSGAAAQFVNDYKTAFPGQDLGAYSAYSYDAANILIAAIKTVISSGKDLTRDGVIAGVQTIQYTGITGNISFDQHGDNAHPLFSLYEVQGGKWFFLKEVTL
jgi:serine/threonine protein kinase/ABC-type branched-subunit amino acid transport system substrate-binding protein